MYISVQENFLTAYADFLEGYVHVFEHFHDFSKHTNFIFIFYLGIKFFTQHFIMKNFKYIEKLKELHSKHPYTHHPDSIIYI